MYCIPGGAMGEGWPPQKQSSSSSILFQLTVPPEATSALLGALTSQHALPTLPCYYLHLQNAEVQWKLYWGCPLPTQTHFPQQVLEQLQREDFSVASPSSSRFVAGSGGVVGHVLFWQWQQRSLDAPGEHWLCQNGMCPVNITRGCGCPWESHHLMLGSYILRSAKTIRILKSDSWVTEARYFVNRNCFVKLNRNMILAHLDLKT